MGKEPGDRRRRGGPIGPSLRIAETFRSVLEHVPLLVPILLVFSAQVLFPDANRSANEGERLGERFDFR